MTDATTPAADRSKFGLALLVIACASALLLIGRIDGAQWVSATTWTVAAYMLGQVGAVVAQGYALTTASKALAAVSKAAKEVA